MTRANRSQCRTGTKRVLWCLTKLSGETWTTSALCNKLCENRFQLLYVLSRRVLSSVRPFLRLVSWVTGLIFNGRQSGQNRTAECLLWSLWALVIWYTEPKMRTNGGGQRTDLNDPFPNYTFAYYLMAWHYAVHSLRTTSAGGKIVTNRKWDNHFTSKDTELWGGERGSGGAGRWAYK